MVGDACAGGGVVAVASSCAQTLACVQGYGAPLCMRVAAIIRRYVDMLPRWAMLVVASRRMGTREHRGQGPMWVFFCTLGNA